MERIKGPSARGRYAQLQGYRAQFLNVGRLCSALTLPYLLKPDDDAENTHRRLVQPWQSVGARAVVNLSAKLIMALLPPQTSFFKLQVRDENLGEMYNPQIKTELELSFSKIERLIMDHVNASRDRVVLHQALKHVIVAGNALLYMSKDGLKSYPLNRYVIDRDGDGNVTEIVTKEMINREIVFGKNIKQVTPVNQPMGGVVSTGSQDDEVEVYTWVRLDVQSGRWKWHQEAGDVIIPNSLSSAPKNTSPWIPLRFNTVDGEAYGRGRVEEFLGDLKSLEALSQALIEGSAAAAKVLFLVSPSATTKPQTIAQAGNGAIVQGRPEDIGVVQVGKTADFRTAAEMAQQLVERINQGFLILNVRNSERTTAEEVRLTQMELESGLGGLFSLMTVEFLVPYLNRTMMVLQRNKQLPTLPKNLVRPQIVAGVNALGRGQDAQALTEFITTVAQTMGPEAIQQYIDPGEYLKRLAAANGIDVLNLIKTPEMLQQEKQQQMQQQQQLELTKQAGQFASAPMMDPSKNPELDMELMQDATGQTLTQETGPQVPGQAPGPGG
jgi:hypothetical protein